MRHVTFTRKKPEMKKTAKCRVMYDAMHSAYRALLRVKKYHRARIVVDDNDASDFHISFRQPGFSPRASAQHIVF
jgi:hypothetical protein